ncbi:ComEC/Rec2 family competence protein [Aliirhizobium smilacinae]|uniref:ComEC family competence protein n=1 Tax=Aliirhizobium smilacinae TaxID=1395944 RepID=A0A5C4XFR9_9HYPH|nr:ComEC/Rec2 family competence protein [Rhizobium smilacinae]TNM62178.1 ComEC family competence protein [Rhizobium smilacinae]
MRSEGFEKIDTKTLNRRPDLVAGLSSYSRSASETAALETVTRRQIVAKTPIWRRHSLAAQASQAGRFVSASIREERLHGHGFLFLPVALGIGSAFWFLSPIDPSLWASIIVFAVLALMALIMRSGWTRIALTFACLVFGGMALAGIETWRRSTVILDSPVTTEVAGVVERSEAAGPGRVRYIIAIRQTTSPTLRRPPARVSLLARAQHEPFGNGDAISGRARLSPPSGPALPGLHDFSFSAYFDGVGAVGYFYSAPQKAGDAEIETGWSELALRWLFDLRRQIGNRIRSAAPGDAGAFAAAIVTDERRAISNDTVEALRISGLAHIVAISGLNMALAAGIFFVGLRSAFAVFPSVAQAWPIKKIAAGGALAMVTSYYLISGFGVSAQRAYIMMAVILVAVLLDRPSISLRNVALSALIILVWTPSEILGPSFQMSFAATVALVAGYAIWARRAQTENREPFPIRHPVVTWITSVGHFIAGIIATSLIGSLATTMFSVEHFHRIATYGLAANLAAMPIISFLVMPAGLIAMLLMPFGLDGPFIAIMAKSLEWVIAIAKHVAGWGGDVVVGQQHPWFLPLGICGFLLLTLLRTRLRYFGLPFLAAASVFFWIGVEQPAFSLIITEDGSLVAYRNAEHVAVNRKRPSEFIFGQWMHARKLPTLSIPEMLDSPVAVNKPASSKERLAEPVLADARRQMRAARIGQFSCLAKAWCTFMSPEGVVVVVVDDGRYAGAACDVAGLVIAPRARFDHCRSGTPMLNSASLRKTGSIEIDFSGSAKVEGWHITTAMDDTVRPWSIHRSYDWRRNIYDRSLPAWLTSQQTTGRLDETPRVIFDAETSGLLELPPIFGGYPAVSDNGE